MNYFPNCVFVFESLTYIACGPSLMNNSDRHLDLDKSWFSGLHWILKYNFWIGFEKHKSLHLCKRLKVKV